MRKLSWIVFSTSFLAASHLTACSGDDDNPVANQDASAGTGGSHTGSGGSAGMRNDASAGSGGVAGSSSGGAAGSGGGAGNIGTGGSGGMEPRDAEVDAAPDVAEPDVEQPEACASEPDDTFCARYRKNCGSFNALNTCGVPYTGTCGACSDTSTCGGSGTLNVCSGTEPLNRAQGGVVTSSRPADKATETPAMVFDNDVKTKWFARTPTVWLAYQFAGGATYTIDAYTVTSANDKPERDPMSWELQGSNDGGVTWTTVDTRVGQTFASRFQTNFYSFTNTTAYSAYRFFVTANAGSSTQFQVAEIQLFQSEGTAPEGGIPDAADGGTTLEDAEAGGTEDVVEGSTSDEEAAVDNEAALPDGSGQDDAPDGGESTDDASLEAAGE
jgi:F5/8 type C domain